MKLLLDTLEQEACRQQQRLNLNFRIYRRGIYELFTSFWMALVDSNSGTLSVRVRNVSTIRARETRKWQQKRSILFLKGTNLCLMF